MQYLPAISPTPFGFILCSAKELGEVEAVGGMGDSVRPSRFLVFFCFYSSQVIWYF